jgi:hypothetical protein
MPTSKAKALTPRQMAPRCAAIPGLMHARRDLARSRNELSRVAALAGENSGIMPHSEKDHRPDAMANLWFLRAVHDFGRAIVTRDHGEEEVRVFTEVLIPTCKRMLQKFISGEVEGVRMDDGGLLTGGLAAKEELRVNALWYNALEMTAAVLKDPPGGTGKDLNTSHHFERLSGRFRRSFAKAYWCSEHNCICTPAARNLPDHGKLPDPDQLLVTLLPASPLPRTKQRQILSRIMEKSLGPLGVYLEHPEHGVVESPLHRVWVALGFAAENHEGLAKAREVLMPLAPLHERAKRMLVHAYYRQGHIVPPNEHKASALASAEILGALAEFDVPV